MKRRAFNLFAVLSLIVGALALVWWPISYCFSVGTRVLDYSPEYIRTDWRRGSFELIICRLDLGNEPDGHSISNFLGIFCLTVKRGVAHVNVIAVPFWMIAVVASILPLLWILTRRRMPVGPGLCVKCGYDLRATPDKCPECGAIPEGALQRGIRGSSTSTPSTTAGRQLRAWTIAVAAIVTAGTIVYVCTRLIGGANASSDNASGSPQTELLSQDVLNRAGITLSIDYQDCTFDGDRISAQRVDFERAHRYCQTILHTELAKYPPLFFQKIKLNKIVFCSGLRRGDVPQVLLAAFSQATLYIDIVVGWPNDSVARHAFHHEVFHMIDEAGGKLASDPEWERLNTVGFSYRGYKSFARIDSGEMLRSDLNGFITRYSTSDEAEDKAEVFAVMMTLPEVLDNLGGKDPILAAKVALLRRRVNALSPELLVRPATQPTSSDPTGQPPTSRH